MKHTNHTNGPRGINLAKGGTHWLEPGQSVELKKEEIAGDLPDLGSPSDAKPSSDDADLVDAVQSENAELKAQVADQAEQIKTLTDENAELKKAK